MPPKRPRTASILVCVYTAFVSDAFSHRNACFHRDDTTSSSTNVPSTRGDVARERPHVKKRSEFLSTASTFATGVGILTVDAKRAGAFEGGVGGLGKVKPVTGIVFRDRDGSLDNSSGGVSTELLAPDGTPIVLSFIAPWPLLKSTSGIESRGLSNPEAAFVQVAEVPEGMVTAEDSLPPSFFSKTIFGQAGKFGAYGSPTDIKIKKISSPSSDQPSVLPTTYVVTFTTLTPAMRESDRKAFVSTKIVGGGVFMLVTGTTANRFKTQEALLREVADSFRCAPAPKSSLRSKQ